MTHTLPPSDEMFGAFLARDTRYDGIFFTGVKSTGIFCRPSCPARKPKRKNVEFFPTAPEALANGYRPCKRCRPLEASGEAPGPSSCGSRWSGRGSRRWLRRSPEPLW